MRALFSLSFERLLAASIIVLEFMGLGTILIHGFCTAFSLFANRWSSGHIQLEQYLVKGLSMGLTFFLAAEILQTATIRTVSDFYLITLIVVLRSLMALYLRFAAAKQSPNPNRLENKTYVSIP